MKQSRLLIETLKRLLKHRGITYKQLAKDLKQSESNVKRIFSQRAFSLETLETMCDSAGVELLELARLSRREKEEELACFTKSQETALAADPKLFVLLYTLISGLDVEAISREFTFTKEECQKGVLKLDKLGLIQLGVNNAVRLRISKNIRWIDDGPLNTLYRADIKKEFLEASFSSRNEKMRFLNGRLSPSAVQSFSRRIDQLIAEFVELAELEKAVPVEETNNIWFLMAYRPWQFSLVGRYRRRGSRRSD